MKKQLCDIIIPIYNAYDDLVECVASVLKHTQATTYRLILINDQSPDERIQAYLDDLASQNLEQVVTLTNQENLGFVKTVNKGMQLSKTNDVVLLNSDTLVSRGWLQKMVNCGYSDDSIATVNPLSNNGALSSVPVMDDYNELPAGYDATSYGELIERISFKDYPPLPTTCGFCFFIKRSVLEHIGYFDAETFGKGYGEENDFCFRAGVYGYRHAIADDAFVLHKGSKSFKGDREAHVKKHAKLLLDRYPFFNPMLSDFVGKNPLNQIQKNVELQGKINNGKQNVLLLLHNDIESGIISVLGGTEYYTKDLIGELKQTHNCFVMVPSDFCVMVYAYINDEMIPFNFEYRERIHITTFHSPIYAALLQTVLEGFAIDIIHVQHFFKHTLDVVSIANQKQIPCYFTAHDFYTITPCMHGYSKKNPVCFPMDNVEACAVELRERLGYGVELFDIWRTNMLKALGELTRIFVPTEAVKQQFLRYFQGEITTPIEVVEHGFNARELPSKQKSISKTFNVAVLGTMAPHKGSDLVAEMIQINTDKSLTFHFFGQEVVGTALSSLPEKQLKQHGAYARETITQQLTNQSIDLVVLASKCFETYSYTLNEALESGIPVLGYEVGAIGERINALEAGWVLPIQANSQATLEKIIAIKNDSQAYQQMKTYIQSIKWVDKATQLQIIAQHYAQYLKQKRSTQSNPTIYKAVYMAWQRANEANRLQELDAILGTVGWRWLQRMKNNRLTKRMLDIMRPKA
jgi:GT2 family glycosyltransferase/glycosyltransferase involved in cell wall biosynthesis